MYNLAFLNSVSLSISSIQIMLTKGKEQGIQNIDPLEVLLQLLKKFQYLANNNEIATMELIDEWDKIYGKIFRAFEGTQIEEHLDYISRQLMLIHG